MKSEAAPMWDYFPAKFQRGHPSLGNQDSTLGPILEFQKWCFEPRRNCNHPK